MALTDRGAVNREPPAELAAPPIIALKDGLWRNARQMAGLEGFPELEPH